MQNLTCLVGAFGSGKSLHLLELGLQSANSFRKPLLVNFPVNFNAIREYCRIYKLKWFAANGLVFCRNLDKLSPLEMLRPDSVVLLDEAGRYLNARKWKSLDSQFSDRLFTLRHYNIHLICSFQFEEQVDKIIRECCQTWISVSGISIYDYVAKRPALLLRFCRYYSSDKFEKMSFDVKLKTNFFLSWKLADKVVFGFPVFGYFVSEFLYLFRIFLWYFSGRSSNLRQVFYKEFYLFLCYNTRGFASYDIPKKKSSPIFVNHPPAISIRNYSDGKKIQLF